MQNLMHLDHFDGLVIHKQWIFKDDINLIDRLYVIQHDISQV